MEQLESHTISASSSKTIRYVSAGPADGPLIIFIHGWPGIAETWLPQLLEFASLGFFVVAADTEGYGGSSSSRDVLDYSLERLVADQLALLKHLNRQKAIWVAHDWGSGILWALVQHHKEVCTGVVNLCVPYRVLELGLAEAMTIVNRDIYPYETYPYAQWDYMVFYEQNPEKATAKFDSDVAKVIKLFYRKGNASGYGQPAITSNITKDQGWFGGESGQIPDVPLETSTLTPELYDAVVKSATKNGFFGPTAYYRNHNVNRPYNLQVKDPTLNMPVLFVHAKYDFVCDTLTSNLAAPMRKSCKDLTEATVEAGHWVNLEKPKEVNDALAGWIKNKLPNSWPGK